MSNTTMINIKNTQKLISLRLPAEYITFLKIKAKEEDRTLSNYIRRLVFSDMNSHKSETDFLLSKKINRNMLLKSKKEAEESLYSVKSLME
jgi:predicted DNA-binding protein